MMDDEQSGQPDSAVAYLGQLAGARIYPVTCLVQSYREYALLVTTVTTGDSRELTEESLVNLVKAEVDRYTHLQLLT